MDYWAKSGCDRMEQAASGAHSSLAPHRDIVSPTFIETPLTKPMLDQPQFRAFVDNMIPLGWIGQPGDVAAAVIYLALSAANMITGTSLLIDGGWAAH
jgi:NAD(P)-dependent dehydrogenase (short-subunit alcohol dehydrogenase family)